MSALRVFPIALAAALLSSPLLAADVFEQALRATVRIASGETSGTGFLVETSPDDPPQYALVTAAHVFAEMQNESCQVVFRERQDDGTFARAEMELTLRDGDEPRWSRHAEVDVAVIPIDLPDDVDVHPFPVSRVADASHAEAGRVRVGQEICIPCFPAKLESNSAGWPILRRGTIASHPLAPLAAAATFFVDVSSFGGESGAPVVAWDDRHPTVVGVITGMHRQTDQVAMPFEQRTVHTPLGIGIAVQSPFVLELLAGDQDP